MRSVIRALLLLALVAVAFAAKDVTQLQIGASRPNGMASGLFRRAGDLEPRLAIGVLWRLIGACSSSSPWRRPGSLILSMAYAVATVCYRILAPARRPLGPVSRFAPLFASSARPSRRQIQARRLRRKGQGRGFRRGPLVSVLIPTPPP